MSVWFCTECGTRHESGNFCTECGTVRYGYKTVPARPAGEYSISRSSVCAGDDCHAPHLGTIPFAQEDTAMTLLEKIADYVPFMSNASWNILNGFDQFACLISGEEKPYKIIAQEPNRLASTLPENSLFCQYNAENTILGPNHFVTSGVLAYGVNVGKYDFQKERVIVYAVSDLPHIGPSDCFTLYQISKGDYQKLMKLARTGNIPDTPVPKEVTDACHQGFLCGESIHQLRNKFTLNDVDLTLAELL